LPAIWLRKLNLNVHLHILALDGAYTFAHGTAHFHRAAVPGPDELGALLSTLITRITRTLVHCTRTCRCREAQGCAGAANASERVHIVARLKAVSKAPSDEPQPSAPTTPMSWMARLNRVFAIDLSTCARLVAANCGPLHTDVQVPRSTRMCECGHCRDHRARSPRTHPPIPARA